MISYMDFNVSKSLEPTPELYNLEKDPSETRNIARQNPEVVSELTKEMDKAHTVSEIDNFRFATPRSARVKNKAQPQGEYTRETSPLFLFISDRINKIYRIILNNYFVMSPKDSFNPVNLVNPVKKSD